MLAPPPPVPIVVQHCSSAGPGQRPGVDTYPGMSAQTEVAMHVPAMPEATHDGAPEELPLLDALVDEPPTVSAIRALTSPLN